ncbi:MAG: NAD-dependent epimerase/dehydratase family protein [FCB group bacterium]|nr:NAD-dependent epimerase/dehydratase family protein [FCB group bacterium]
MAKRICLIGGAGFIGHNLAVALRREGHEVSVVDFLAINNEMTLIDARNRNKNTELYLWMVQERQRMFLDHDIPLYVQDARNYHELCKLLADEIRPEVVVQLAAVSHAGRSNKDPFSTFDHSFRTLENALDNSISRLNALDSSVIGAGEVSPLIEHFVYFSSSTVLGDFESDTVTEETICRPKGIYAALKLSGELLTKAYNQIAGLPYTIIRPSALYGPRCVSRRVGQIYIESAMQGGVLEIRGDGSSKSDFTCIDDLVQGLQKIIKSPRSRNETFNITAGEGRRLKDLAKIVQVNFPGTLIQYQKKDDLFPDRGTLSIEKARKLLGYSPQFKLETGIPALIRWYREDVPKNLIRKG